MKKRILWVIFVLIILFPVVCWGQGRDTSDRSAADALICTGHCLLFGVFIETDGTNNATLIIYDGTLAGGKVIRKIIVPGPNYYGGFELPGGLICKEGIYADISGTDAAYWVSYGKW